MLFEGIDPLKGLALLKNGGGCRTMKHCDTISITAMQHGPRPMLFV